MIKYFTPEELRCSHCGVFLVDADFLKRLNRARELAGFQFVVYSGYRCEEHNRAIGSTSTNHTEGKAVDIKCISDHKRFLVIRSMIEAGILGIGVHKTFIHCDINRTAPAIWLY